MSINLETLDTRRMWVYVVCTAVLLLVYYASLIGRWMSVPTPNHGTPPPGSKGLPLIGETFQVLSPSYTPGLHPFVKLRIRKYGPIFRTNILGQQVVVSTDPKFNNYIIQQEGSLVEMWYLRVFSKLLQMEGESLMNVLGKIHKSLRSITLSHFGSEILTHGIIPQIEETISGTMKIWLSQDFVDVQTSLSSMAFEFAAKVMIHDNYDPVLVNMAKRMAKLGLSIFSFPLNIRGTTYYKLLKEKRKFKDILKRIIKERPSSSGTPNASRDFLEQAIFAMRKKFFIEDRIVSFIFAILLANSDSLSRGLTLLLNCVSKHPSVRDELLVEHQAILEKRGNRSSCLTWEEYRSMKFTHQVINESLRLGNIAGVVLRRTLKDIQVNGTTLAERRTMYIIKFQEYLRYTGL